MSQAKFNPTVERSYQPSSATIGKVYFCSHLSDKKNLSLRNIFFQLRISNENLTLVYILFLLPLLLGLDKAQRLLMIGAGCLIIVFIFGVILCRLDISAGKRKTSIRY